MEREKKMTLGSGKSLCSVYVTYEDRQLQTPILIRVQLAGDLLDITEKLTDRERRSIERRLVK